MKWFYRIIRLFFCPHKLEHISTTEQTPVGKDYVVARRYRYECKLCGKPKFYKVKV